MQLFLGTFLCICGGASADIKSYFKEVKLIPDIFDENVKIPEEKLAISFGGNKVTFGEEYTPTYLKDSPIVEMNFDPNSYYTFMMLNADWMTPRNPSLRPGLTMLVTNIPGNDFSKGDIIVKYSGTAPLKNSGVYRYVLALYRQPDKISFDETHLESRERGYRVAWPLTNFLAKYHLTDLVAVHVQYTQWDEYASQIHTDFLNFKPQNKQT